MHVFENLTSNVENFSPTKQGLSFNLLDIWNRYYVRLAMTGSWYWFIMREKYCLLVVGADLVREKNTTDWLADKSNEQSKAMIPTLEIKPELCFHQLISDESSLKWFS